MKKMLTLFFTADDNSSLFRFLAHIQPVIVSISEHSVSMKAVKRDRVHIRDIRVQNASKSRALTLEDRAAVLVERHIEGWPWLRQNDDCRLMVL